MTATNSKKKKTDTTYSVPGLERGLAILEYLAEHPEGKSQNEISEELKCPTASVFRMTLSLEKAGYLVRNPKTKAFRHTMKMLMLGQKAISEIDLVGNSLPTMRKLRDSLHDTVALGVLNELEIIVLESVLGSHLFRFSLTAGHRIGLHASAPGKAILGFLPEDQRNRIAKQINFVKYNENTISSLSAFQRELASVREKGYSVDRGEEYSSIYCLGAPIFDRNAYPVAAIWVTGPDNRVKPSQYPDIGEQMREGALEISRVLGYQGR
jgi:DNA-binding IclR family transcriptional regulator